MHKALPLESNRCAALQDVAWIFYYIMSFSRWVHRYRMWYTRFVREERFPKSFMYSRALGVSQKLGVLGFFFSPFALWEIVLLLHGPNGLSTPPHDFSRSYMGVVNQAFLGTGWWYPVHASTSLHIQCMNKIWILLNLATS